MKRIRFTRMELEVINEMAAIASAAPKGEGDYANWGDKHDRAFDSLRGKVWDLIARYDGLPNNLGDQPPDPPEM